MPNSKINNGVMSDPPPMPVMPTRRPTPKPESEYSGSIIYGYRPSSAYWRWPEQGLVVSWNSHQVCSRLGSSTTVARAEVLFDRASFRPREGIHGLGPPSAHPCVHAT